MRLRVSFANLQTRKSTLVFWKVTPSTEDRTGHLPFGMVVAHRWSLLAHHDVIEEDENTYRSKDLRHANEHTFRERKFRHRRDRHTIANIRGSIIVNSHLSRNTLPTVTLAAT